MKQHIYKWSERCKVSMGWLVLNLLEYLGGFSTKKKNLINVKFFKNIFLKDIFLKEKGRIFWNILFGNGILEIN
jgi:hypothetical protein